MTHRKGNKIRTISDEDLARQACDLWDKFEAVRVTARFLTLHDELDRRHGGKGGGAKFINAEKKRRNMLAAGTPYKGSDDGMIDINKGSRVAPDERMVAALRAIRKEAQDWSYNTSMPLFLMQIEKLCEYGLGQKGKPDDVARNGPRGKS